MGYNKTIYTLTSHYMFIQPQDLKSAMIRNNRPAKLRNVIFEINQVFALLVCNHIVEMYVFVSPLEVVDDALVCQFLLNDKQILKKVDNPLVDVKVIEFSNHSLLVLKILVKRVNQRITFIDDTSDVVKDLSVGVFF